MLRRYKLWNNVDSENHIGEKLSNSYSDNLSKIDKKFSNCPDIVRRKIILKNNHPALLLYVEGLVNIDLMQRDFLNPILNMEYTDLQKQDKLGIIPVASLSFPFYINEVVNNVLSGNTVLIVEGINYAISGSLNKFENRAMGEPITEKNIRGSHEGFIENIKTNMSLLRKLIRNKDLKFNTFNLGEATNQTLSIAYIDGIANPELLKILCEKISSINSDGFLSLGSIEQRITDHPNSFFPQFLATERPDKAVAGLLEGRFVLMLDGTCDVLIVPITFFSFFEAADDYSTNWMFGSFLRFLRIFGGFIAIFLPGLYIAILSFHYFSVPLNLLIPLAESRVRVPFPPIIEALIMEITLEMLRESAIRLPTYIGASIGVVGGLIIGQAAVQAGIVSNLMIIVVAVTAIASFLSPTYDMGLSLRLIRFFVMILSAVIGIIGIVIAFAFLLVHLISMESLGQPYMQPIFPLKLKDLVDSIVRLPMGLHKTRPNIAQPVNKKRGNGNA